MLGSLLFDIRKMHKNVCRLISTFADDTKIGGHVDSEDVCRKVQRDIDQLKSWAKCVGMEHEPDKCKVMHFASTTTGW